MNLYVIRHGETDWNRNKMIQGQTDTELNSVGIKQAHDTKEKLKEIPFNCCYCSPLKRVINTANIIMNNQDITIIDDLIERNYGDYEGNQLPDFHLKKQHWDYKLNSCENHLEPVKNLLLRCQKVKEQILNTNFDNVLVVGHGATLKALHYCLMGYDENTNFLDFKLDNCEVCVYNIENNEVIKYNKI